MVRFRMIKINTEQFAVLGDFPSKEGNMSLETNLRFKVSENNKVAPVVRFTFLDNKKPILLIEVCCEFDIHPNDWAKMLKGRQVTIPKDTLEYLSMQTVGTARGILHCKTEGTQFNVFLIPPINVSSMIRDDLKITLKDKTE